MLKIYGIEPDLCITNPHWITDCPNDIILPQYFYVQLEYIKNSNFNRATEASQQILDSLEKQEYSNLLLFQTTSNCLRYFANQEVAWNFINENHQTIDIAIPINRYLVTLFMFAGYLKWKVEFLALSSEVIYLCQKLGFGIATPESFFVPSTSGLETTLIQEVQIRLDPLAQIQWQEDIDEAIEQVDFIQWIDLNR